MKRDTAVRIVNRAERIVATLARDLFAWETTKHRLTLRNSVAHLHNVLLDIQHKHEERNAPIEHAIMWALCERREGVGLFMTKYVFAHWRGVGLVSVHCFHRQDIDVEHHNHPFLYGVSLCLSGGYVEERIEPIDKTLQFEVRRRTTRPGSIVFVAPSTRHRVAELTNGPCWTLFVQSASVRPWGFTHPESMVYEEKEAFASRKRHEALLKAAPQKPLTVLGHVKQIEYREQGVLKATTWNTLAKDE